MHFPSFLQLPVGIRVKIFLIQVHVSYIFEMPLALTVLSNYPIVTITEV